MGVELNEVLNDRRLARVGIYYDYRTHAVLFSTCRTPTDTSVGAQHYTESRSPRILLAHNEGARLCHDGTPPPFSQLSAPTTKYRDG